MCRQVDIERDEIVTLSREEFRELSLGILGYNAIQHAKVFCAWKQAKQQEHQVAAVKSSNNSDEEEEEIPTPVAAQSGSWISPEKVGSTSQNIEKGRAKNLATNRSATVTTGIAAAAATVEKKEVGEGDGDRDTNSPVPVRKKRKESLLSADEGVGDSKMQHEREPEESSWLQTVENAGKIYRMREFPNRAKSDADHHGRSPSIYAIANGVIVHEMPSSVMNSLGPTKNLTVPLVTQAFDSILEGERNRNVCQWNRDRMFCSMQNGDIVRLLIPNEKYRHEVCCGVVTSDKIVVKETHKLASEMGLVQFEGISYYLASREVKRLRRVKMRDLPGQSTTRSGRLHVPWLVEFGPLFLLDVTENARCIC